MSVPTPGANPDGCIVVAVEDAPARLAQLGLTVEVLTDSVTTGDTQRKQKMLAHYPRNYPSIVAWAETLAQLRRRLISLQVGWDINNYSNYETVFLREKLVSIAVAGGDKRTGLIADRNPKLARKRGPMTTDRVRKNVVIGQIAFDLGPKFEPLTGKKKEPADLGCQTWFLVIFPDKDEVRLELFWRQGLTRRELFHIG